MGVNFISKDNRKLVKCVFKEKVLLKFNIHRVKSTGVYFFFFSDFCIVFH